MRVLVTGPRDWDDWSTVKRACLEVSAVCAGYDTVTLVEGEAPGADTMFKTFGRRLGWTIEPYPANWYPNGKYDRTAGHKRNQVMVNSGADVCLALLAECQKSNCRRDRPHWTHGTTDCIKRAERAGIPVRRYCA
jgi:hypothetical protein